MERVAVPASHDEPQDLDNGLCLLIVFDFTVPVWICSMFVKGPRLSFTLRAKVKDLGTPARAFCSYKWSDTEAPSNRSCSTGSWIECSVPAFHRAACATMAQYQEEVYHLPPHPDMFLLLKKNHTCSRHPHLCLLFICLISLLCSAQLSSL